MKIIFIGQIQYIKSFQICIQRFEKNNYGNLVSGVEGESERRGLSNTLARAMSIQNRFGISEHSLKIKFRLVDWNSHVPDFRGFGPNRSVLNGVVRHPGAAGRI